MDIENIFDSFSSEESKSVEKEIEKFKSTPGYRVSMFKKIIFNHLSFNDSFVELIKSYHEGLDGEDIKEAGENIMYENAWEQISKIDIKDPTHLIALINNNDEGKYLITALKLSISFFEEYEEYEKCAFLKIILDTFADS